MKNIIYFMLAFAWLSISNIAWAGRLHLNGTRVNQVAFSTNDEARPVLVFRAANVTNVTYDNAAERGRCYNNNDATYELRFEKDNRYYKDILAAALTSYSLNKRYALSADAPSCTIINFGLND